LIIRQLVFAEELKPRRKSSTPKDEQVADAQFESFDSALKAAEPVIEMELSPDTSLGETTSGIYKKKAGVLTLRCRYGAFLQVFHRSNPDPYFPNDYHIS
jgi:hypothetical protein